MPLYHICGRNVHEDTQTIYEFSQLSFDFSFSETPHYLA